jgi:hypothetical protein
MTKSKCGPNKHNYEKTLHLRLGRHSSSFGMRKNKIGLKLVVANIKERS